MSLNPNLEKKIKCTPDDIINIIITADYNDSLETAVEGICIDATWLGERQLGLISAQILASKVKALQKVKGVVYIELDETATIQ